MTRGCSSAIMIQDNCNLKQLFDVGSIKTVSVCFVGSETEPEQIESEMGGWPVLNTAAFTATCKKQ